MFPHLFASGEPTTIQTPIMDDEKKKWDREYSVFDTIIAGNKIKCTCTLHINTHTNNIRKPVTSTSIDGRERAHTVNVTIWAAGKTSTNNSNEHIFVPPLKLPSNLFYSLLTATFHIQYFVAFYFLPLLFYSVRVCVCFFCQSFIVHKQKLICQRIPSRFSLTFSLNFRWFILILLLL